MEGVTENSNSYLLLKKTTKTKQKWERSRQWQLNLFHPAICTWKQSQQHGRWRATSQLCNPCPKRVNFVKGRFKQTKVTWLNGADASPSFAVCVQKSEHLVRLSEVQAPSPGLSEPTAGWQWIIYSPPPPPLQRQNSLRIAAQSENKEGKVVSKAERPKVWWTLGRRHRFSVCQCNKTQQGEFPPRVLPHHRPWKRI